MLFKKELKESPLNQWEKKSIMLVIPPKNDNEFIKGIYNRTTEVEILFTTGAHTNFSKQNIFDFAGNVYEWTLEKTPYPESPCAIRGGNFRFNGDDFPASSRTSYSPDFWNNCFGFRVALY